VSVSTPNYQSFIMVLSGPSAWMCLPVPARQEARHRPAGRTGWQMSSDSSAIIISKGSMALDASRINGGMQTIPPQSWFLGPRRTSSTAPLVSSANLLICGSDFTPCTTATFSEYHLESSGCSKTSIIARRYRLRSHKYFF